MAGMRHISNKLTRWGCTPLWRQLGRSAGGSGGGWYGLSSPRTSADSAAAWPVPRRAIFSWLGGAAKNKTTGDRALADQLLEAAARDMSPVPPSPMLESANPALKQLAEQYAQANCGFCGTSPEGGALSFSCPRSGFPSHCSEECYEQDTAHHAIAEDLRMIHQDYADLRAGRPFNEFKFPGPPSHDFIRGDLNNWVSFLSDREFRNALDKGIGWARSDEEKFIEARSMRLISSVFSFPLTIAHAVYWKSALGDPAKLDSRKDEDGNLIPNRIAILGPRAEAVLPTRAWLELNAIFPEAPFELHFVGPEIPDDKHETVLEIPEHKLTLKWSKALYEDVHEFHELPDLFVIFNSGEWHLPRRLPSPTLPVVASIVPSAACRHVGLALSGMAQICRSDSRWAPPVPASELRREA